MRELAPLDLSGAARELRKSEDAGLDLELLDELRRGADLDARRAARRFGDLHDLQLGRDVDAEASVASSSSGFFLAFMMLGSEA